MTISLASARTQPRTEATSLDARTTARVDPKVAEVVRLIEATQQPKEREGVSVARGGVDNRLVAELSSWSSAASNVRGTADLHVHTPYKRAVVASAEAFEASADQHASQADLHAKRSQDLERDAKALPLGPLRTDLLYLAAAEAKLASWFARETALDHQGAGEQWRKASSGPGDDAAKSAEANGKLERFYDRFADVYAARARELAGA